ncbi:hypothetical protein VNO78_25039 [Psophocarpus tetragonolobus]|uniref:Uncharacterized protein n=1 Tax=Psophocarpus tetragonolobus TaxID=3891 RepID=A0AAN9S9C7_PSOTE
MVAADATRSSNGGDLILRLELMLTRCFSMEILRSEVVVVDVGVRPYSSMMPTTSNPVGPLSDTRIHVAPTHIFPSTVKLSSSIFLVHSPPHYLPSL